MNDRLKCLLETLHASRDIQLKIAMSLLTTVGGLGEMFDILAIAALNRSACLIEAFILLLEKRNFVSAAPLLRLQIDSCLRLYAYSLVSDPDAFAVEVLKGKSIRSLKSAGGKDLTDAFLRKEFSKRAPWVDDVYEHTSGYIHLSEKHCYNAFSLRTGSDKHIEFKIGSGDYFVPDEVYEDAVDRFIQATNALSELIEEQTKGKERRLTPSLNRVILAEFG